MSAISDCDPERIERLVLGELSPAEAAEAQTHAADCPACRDELALLHAERDAFAVRAAALARVPDFAPAAPAVVTIAPRPRVRSTRLPWAMAAAGAVAIAAATLLYLRVPAPVTPSAAVHESIAADPAVEPAEQCVDDFSEERKKLPPKGLACEDPRFDAGVTNTCRTPLSR